jgi:phosphoribosylaminoimidazole (AIR) synthetase
MGIGMVVFVAPEKTETISQQFQKLGEQVYLIGEVVQGSQEVHLKHS